MLKIEPFKQTDDSRCGPASIKMILSFYGLNVSEDELCDRCNWTYELGCTDFQMKEAIESYGFECIIFNDSSLENIEDWIQREIPVIVDWFSPGIDFGDIPNGHSSVVVNIDKEFIYLFDPELGGLRVIKREEFMRVWFDWREDPIIKRWEDLVLRQAIVVFKK